MSQTKAQLVDVVGGVGNGTAALPALTGDDADTGISFGTNEVSVSTNGNERFRFGSAGQLGIGGATYGTSGQALLSQGSGSAPQWGDVAADGAFRSVQYYTTNGTHTWTKPAGLKRVRVFVTGGGGGGKGHNVGNTQGGTGGGAGGTAVKVIEEASLGATETVTVGAGGAGNSNTNSRATNGGSSSFGSHCSATGGGGGDRATVSPYIDGGLGSGGNLNIQGGAPICSNTTVNEAGSCGGDSYFAGGGRSAKTNGTYAHGAVGQFGSGGGGGNTSGAGATGGNGIVVVEQYF